MAKRSVSHRLRPALAFLIAALLVPGAAQTHASPDQWRQEGWKTDFSRHEVDLGAIMSGGPPRDGIPSIDDPKLMPAAGVQDLKPAEPVIGLELADEARAYPLRILVWHEIVNDVVSGVPLAVTYCPLCNAAIVFDRRVGDRVLSFGTTGKLRNSDLVMYDRQTETWWQQFTGEAIVGALAGTTLRMVPARLESFGSFKQRHPEGLVLVPANPAARDYGRNPYVGYDSSERPFLFTGELPPGIHPLARVVVVRPSEGDPRAVALELLRKRRTMNLGEILLTWSEGQSSALDAANIADGHDVGNVVAQRIVDGRLQDVSYDVTFAFVFFAFHPNLPILKE